MGDNWVRALSVTGVTAIEGAADVVNVVQCWQGSGRPPNNHSVIPALYLAVVQTRQCMRRLLRRGTGRFGGIGGEAGSPFSF